MIGQSDELHLPSVGHDSKKISPYDHLQNPALCAAGVYMWECRNAEIGSEESFFINQSDIIHLSICWSFFNQLVSNMIKLMKTHFPNHLSRTNQTTRILK